MKRLLIEYWDCPIQERKKELDQTIQMNIDSGLFDEICIFSESQTDNFHNANVLVGARKTVSEMISYSNSISSDEDVNILSNTDIFFDNSIEHLNELENDDVYCLSRWEDNIPFNRFIYSNSIHDDFSVDNKDIDYIIKTDVQNLYSMSADVWCWKGKINIQKGNFNLGILGCDNVLSYQFRLSGKTISNPFHKVKVHHNHKSNLRPGLSSNEDNNILFQEYGCYIPVDKNINPVKIDYRKNMKVNI